VTRSQWGIAMPHGWYQWEEDMTARKEHAVQVPENKEAREPLLYGPRGEVILERRPRPIGFRSKS
jgi:hypothetical protein